MSDVLQGLDEVVEQPVVEEPKVEAPAEKAPEAKAESKPETKPEEKETRAEPKTIPLAAYLEDKNKWSSKFEAMERELNALKNPPKAPAAQPEFIEDPKGYVDHGVKTALEKLQEVQEQVKATGKTAEEVQAETRFNRFMSDLQATEITFKQANPDYLDALAHLRNARAAEIQLTAPDITQEQLFEIIKREELGLAHQLMQRGRNPHEIAYQLAKARGYQKKEAVPAVPEVPTQKQLPPDQTLGSGSGSPNSGEIAIPDGEEFDLALKQVFGRKRA